MKKKRERKKESKQREREGGGWGDLYIYIYIYIGEKEGHFIRGMLTKITLFFIHYSFINCFVILLEN
jgi:hypothetical protein